MDGTKRFVEKQHDKILRETRDRIFHKSTLYPPHSESQTPDWLSYNREVSGRIDSSIISDWPIEIVMFFQILCFSAYHETHSDNVQIRQVKILFYLEDSSIQVHLYIFLLYLMAFNRKRILPGD